MDWDAIKNMGLEDFIKLPLKVKLAGSIVLFAIMGVLTWIWFITPVNQQFDSLKAQETELKSKIMADQRLASDIPGYQAQIQEIKNRFKKFLRELPNSSQIPSLLDGITLSGKRQGLQFNLFKPQNNTQKQFYTIIPVQVQVDGTYNQIGRFIGEVGAMPRIVTVHDINIQVKKAAGPNSQGDESNNELSMNCTMMTYKYTSENTPNAKK